MSSGVVLVHERFTELGGSERVVEQLHRMWPDAPIRAPLVDQRGIPAGLAGADIAAGPLQRLYRGGGSYAHVVPLLPIAMARMDVADAELVVCSHHAFANRVRPAPGVPVVSYVHTPARWLWEPAMRRLETDSWMGRTALTAFAATQRRADRAAAARLRAIIVNSNHVAGRVRRWWGREADVVPPPVDVDRFTPDPHVEREDFFLVAGRLVPYKQPEVAIEAANRTGVPLVVAGDGRARKRFEAMAGPTVRVLGGVDDAELLRLYRSCRALVFPGEEDFGIVPVEAMACGAPVIARGVGGALDTVVPGLSGEHFAAGDDPVAALSAALLAFDPSAYDSAAIRQHALQFSPALFRTRTAAVIARHVPGFPLPQQPVP